MDARPKRETRPSGGGDGKRWTADDRQIQRSSVPHPIHPERDRSEALAVTDPCEKSPCQGHHNGSSHCPLCSDLTGTEADFLTIGFGRENHGKSRDAGMEPNESRGNSRAPPSSLPWIVRICLEFSKRGEIHRKIRKDRPLTPSSGMVQGSAGTIELSSQTSAFLRSTGKHAVAHGISSALLTSQLSTQVHLIHSAEFGITEDSCHDHCLS